MTLGIDDALLLPTLALYKEVPQNETAPVELDCVSKLLTTANIIYCLPDHPLLLQEYLWQDYDHAPRFPVFSKFISFWQRELDGKIHTVQLTVRDALKPIEFQFYAKEYALH